VLDGGWEEVGVGEGVECDETVQGVEDWLKSWVV
jgi:hypothetical protein